jgi:hypothetical protein
MNIFALFILNLLIHLTHDVRPLIKFSFNILKFARGLDALSLGNVSGCLSSKFGDVKCLMS